MLAFIPERMNYLDALVQREGRGPWWSKGCMGTGCLQLEAEYRCEDCFGGRLLCRSCILDRHRDEPLHLVQRWLDHHFQPCTLQSIDPGLRFQLGHAPGEDCDFRDPRKFVVLDNNTIHEVQVDFCGCLGAPPIRDQLVNIGWFPATVKEPETVATLSLLRRFHTLNLQGRVPAYDFYNALERAGRIEVPVLSGKYVPYEAPGNSVIRGVLGWFVIPNWNLLFGEICQLSVSGPAACSGTLKGSAKGQALFGGGVGGGRLR
ncbi:hypothetical protein B0H15DRAFT_793414 [Mycena belliarum]|uniref:CxC2-like cysteine cluster KDZ transposase-associated domain-containing protein n=1 Tax=Mycena belliarum TaxID=1033014 RepID=A0AAD6TM20_9AGAR|nr:hypothetical protein B0H15DRAFT_793414 [Mycena belliae]